MRQFFGRLAAVLQRKRFDREMDEEIASHLELAAADLQSQGMRPEHARLAAQRHFGSVTRTKDAERDSRGFPILEDLVRDIRYAIRGMRRNVVSTAMILIVMAIGTGATATIFSAVDNVLLRTIPVTDPERVVGVHAIWNGSATATPRAGSQIGPTSYPDYVDLRDSGILQGLAAFAPVAVKLDHGGIVEQIDGQIVTGNYFDVLGVRAVVGRLITDDDDRFEAPARVVTLSYRTWRQRYGGRPDVVGQSITVNAKPYVVIGVAPAAFFGSMLGDTPELWVPMALQPEIRPPSAGALRQRMTISTSGVVQSGALREFRDVGWLELVGRLKSGVSIAQTAAALDVVGRRLAAAYPDSNRDRSVTVMRLGEAPGVRSRALPVLKLLGIAVTLVLLIASANVASLLLARAVSRRREVAVRVAMGAGRARLIRQWLTESILLGVLGAVGGLLVAYWGTPLLDGLGVLEKIDVSVNPHVLAFTLGCGVATGMMFGLAPTVQLASGNTLPALRDESGAVTTGSRTTRLRSIFIVVQVGLSLILLVGAALFIGAFRHALAIDLGYRVDRMLLADIAPGDKYSAPASVTFYRDVLERVNALPGVVAAGAARVTVLSGASRTVLVSVDGQPLQKDQANAIPVRANVISDRYLEAMGISVLQGRGIQASDVPGTAPVALVTQSLAKRLWPDKNAIGETLVSDSSMQVVGVVPDTVYRSGTDRDPRPFYYVPLAQHPEAGVTLHIRTTGDPMAVLPAVRRVVQDLDPTIALLRPRRLLDEFDRSTMPQRTMAMLIGTLSAIALLLAAVGLYGVMAYATRQRTTEIGLRLALGATPGSVLNLIVMRGVRLVAFGLLIGVVGAVASVRFVRGQLFGVEPTDPTTWFVVVAVLLLITLVACAVPAARAMRTEPSTALRTL